MERTNTNGHISYLKLIINCSFYYSLNFWFYFFAASLKKCGAGHTPAPQT